MDESRLQGAVGAVHAFRRWLPGSPLYRTLGVPQGASFKSPRERERNRGGPMWPGGFAAEEDIELDVKKRSIDIDVNVYTYMYK